MQKLTHRSPATEEWRSQPAGGRGARRDAGGIRNAYFSAELPVGNSHQIKRQYTATQEQLNDTCTPTPPQAMYGH